jgi:hypothetical protein
MSIVKPFADHGNFTQIHNVVFDVIMPRLSPNAFKVLCYVIRRTKGFHKKSESLSYSEIQNGTGIGGSATVRAAIVELVKGGYILKKDGPGQWDKTAYALNQKCQITTSETEATSETEVRASTSETEAVLTSETEGQSTSETEENVRKESTSNKLKERVLVADATPAAPTKNQTLARAPKGANPPQGSPPQPTPQSTPADPLTVATLKALGVTAGTTEKRRKEAIAAAAALAADGRTPEQVERFAANWWKRSYWGCLCAQDGRAVRRPRPEEIRDEFDDILNLSNQQPTAPQPQNKNERKYTDAIVYPRR